MRRLVFADTAYWVVLMDRRDLLHEAAQFWAIELEQGQITTSDAVLIEFVNYFSKYSDITRQKVNCLAFDLLRADDVNVLPHHRSAIFAGLSLHASRPDKQYSLTDCISMQMMRELGIFEILTHDHHFAQEGFVALMRSSS
jgi:predicted nucleic acid-binding protein